MADLFISEVLILFFLLIVLLRPFSKFLKAVPAVVIFPLIAIVLSLLVIAGQGIYFSIVLLFFFSVLIFLFTLPKFSAFVTGLGTQQYSGAEIGVHIFGLLLLCGMFFLTGKFVPVSVVDVSGKVIRQDIVLQDFSRRRFGEVFLLHDIETDQPIDADNAKKTIIFLPNVKKSRYETDTAVRFFLQSGYKVVCIENFQPVSPFVPKNFYNFSAAFQLWLHTIFSRSKGTVSTELSAEAETQFTDILQRIIKNFGGDSVFIFSSGMYSAAFLKNFDAHFAETVCGAFMVDADGALPIISGSFSAKRNEQIIYTGEVKQARAFLYTVPADDFSQFGELRGDDPLLTVLLGGTIDIARASRSETARIAEKWIYVKSTVD